MKGSRVLSCSARTHTKTLEKQLFLILFLGKCFVSDFVKALTQSSKFPHFNGLLENTHWSFSIDYTRYLALTIS